MADEAFDADVERLFAEAPSSADDELFVRAVTARTSRLRRAWGVLPTVATAVGGLVAVLELSQPSLWIGLADWLNRVGAPLTDPKLWTTPNATICAAAFGVMALSAYLVRVLREN